MIAVRVVEASVDPIVDVVAVGDGRMPAAGVVVPLAVDRGAGSGEAAIHLEPVLVVVSRMGRVKVSVVEIVGMIAVADPLVTAARPMRVRVFPVIGACHRRTPSRPDRLALEYSRQWWSVLFLSALTLACGGSGVRRVPVAAATIAPLSDLLARVAGREWDVRTIVPPGTSPHVFEPTPGDVRRLAGVRLVVEVGGGYDGWAAGLASAASGTAVLLDASASLGEALDANGAGDPHHGSDGEEGRDPHWWLSPALAARSLEPIAEALSRIDPGESEGYRARAAQTAKELASLDGELEAALTPFRGRAFLAAHPAWSYFAARYGLRQAGSIEPAPGREPSPRQLRALIDDARSGEFDVLFTEPQFPESAARVVASDGGLHLARLDPIGGVAGRRTYFEMMRFNGAAFVSAFGLPRRRPR